MQFTLTNTQLVYNPEEKWLRIELKWLFEACFGGEAGLNWIKEVRGNHANQTDMILQLWGKETKTTEKAFVIAGRDNV